MILTVTEGEGEGHGHRYSVVDGIARDARPHAVGPRAHRRVPRHAVRPRAHGRVRVVEGRALRALRWALVLAGCWALVRLLIELSWGLWAVTR